MGGFNRKNVSISRERIQKYTSVAYWGFFLETEFPAVSCVRLESNPKQQHGHLRVKKQSLTGVSQNKPKKQFQDKNISVAYVCAAQKLPQ